ncbi:uncharacterized protein LOC143196224 isoform X2 [Rhynchophorus ferrugineus]|uniref:uncharacterized protein LOC143196224 isoform X2 n=1 Tax=Rhynchophorus ferrugineus TaxID=354439 RepID=UPI003FCCFA52
MDSSQNFYAVVRGEDNGLERAVLKSEFSKFGDIQKIFINHSQNFAKVYFNSEESVKEACKHLNGKKSFSVEYLRTSHSKRPRNVSKSSEDPEDFRDVCSISSHSLNGIDCASDSEYIYVDCHGRPVEVLEGDDGKLYVSLDHIRRAGFELFLKDSYDNAVITQDIDLKHFMSYMLNQGMRYALKYKKIFNEKEVCNTFEKVKEILENRSLNKVEGHSKNLVIKKNIDQAVNGFHKDSKSAKNEGQTKNNNKVLSSDHNDKNHRRNQNQANTWQLKKPLENISLEMGVTYKIKVTAVRMDKKTVFYAQLYNNQSLVDRINGQINSSDSKNEEIKNPRERTVGIAYHNNSWYRSQVIKVRERQVTVRLLDFGYRVNINVPLRFLSEKSRWPAQAIKLILGNQDNHEINEGDILEIEIKKVYENAFLVSIKDGNVSEADSSESCFTQIPSSPIELKPDESVMIVGFSKNHLTLRNRACAEFSKNLYTYLSTFKMVPIKNPKIGQIVLARKEEFDGMHRAILKKTTDGMAEIEYIDYCGGNTVPIESLKNVDKEISSISCSKIVSPPYPCLKDIDETGVAFLKELIARKTKLKVVLEKAHFDLMYNDGSDSVSLSQKLTKTEQQEVKVPEPKSKQSEVQTVVLEKEPSIDEAVKPVSLSDMNYIKLEKGKELYLCYTCSGRSITLLKTSDDVVKYMAQLEVLDMKDTEHFAPEVEQMCLAKHEHSWYRATVLERNPDGKSFEVLFVDYGNISTVQKEDVRKLPQEFAAIPILGISAYFEGIPKDQEQKVYDRLKELLPDDSILEVDVKTGINEDFEYGIEIPSIYAKLKEEKLL